MTQPRQDHPVGPAPRLHAQVRDIIGTRILQGVLAPGARLQESHLAAEFGISRAPTRQALSALEAQGLISKAEGRGYVVSEIADGIAAADELGSGATTLDVSASWERIYLEVENEIIARISFGSWRLSEMALASHYGVSRTVARDVVGRLQQRGLVRKDDGARWYAPALTPDHIGELYEMRWLLEPAALLKAVPNLPQGLLDTMSADLDAAIASADTIGGDVLDTLEDQLHVRLLAFCGQNTLMQAITQHQSLLVAHHFLYRWTPKLFRSEPFLPEHREILDRLLAGRFEDASRSLKWHLQSSSDRVIARVDLIKDEFHTEGISFLTLAK
ncbi:GntR family transcriptional regulator [Pelagibacterium montanilacus]|uniref:GntR family transcriptional regulator n=1 Tax=Pelagibacterium montanilacus TaxID=2185280 RepID=UPI0013E09B71|nr:GntR family transcriptional regulator [Pelagibacterium montanilacus]